MRNRGDSSVSEPARVVNTAGYRKHTVICSTTSKHIVAKQHGGLDETGNLALACHRCDLYKGPISRGSIQQRAR